ncbi:MAG: hypothetical protein K2J48_05380, partial [Muribaculaceae bacterium]|nr:hypothetical protein [Muribaculaceae bacterium]
TITLTAAAKTTEDLSRAGGTGALTDLKEGKLVVEIPVMQYTNGSSFIIDGYGEDIDWNTTGDSQLNITVRRYTTDKNWDTGMDTGLTVKVEGYTGDKNWNSGGGDTDFNISQDGYGTDKELSGEGGNVNISVNGYGPDKNQDPVAQ